jgi:hypothetical protein
MRGDVIWGLGDGEVRKLASFAAIQDLLMNTTLSNVLDTNIQVADGFPSPDPSDISDMCHLFITAAKFRHYNIPALVEILDCVIRRSSLLPSFNRTNATLPYHYRFVIECLRKEIISPRDLIASIRAFLRDPYLITLPFRESHYIAQWSSPYLLQDDRDLVRRLGVVEDASVYEEMVDIMDVADFVYEEMMDIMDVADLLCRTSQFEDLYSTRPLNSATQ